MKRKYFIPLLSSIILLLSSCVENSDPFRPGTGGGNGNGTGTGTGTGSGGSGNGSGTTGTPVDYGHEAIAGEWEIFYTEKTIKYVGGSEIGKNRYPDRDGFTARFYGGGSILGDPQKGYFQERNAFGKLIVEGTYEIAKRSNAYQKDSLKTYYKSIYTGLDTIATVFISGTYDKYFSTVDQYQIINNTQANYDVSDEYFYRNKERSPDFNFSTADSKNKARHKSFLIDSKLIYGDWMLSKYEESRDGQSQPIGDLSKVIGESVRFSNDGTFTAFPSGGYDHTQILSPGRFVVVDDVIHAYLVDYSVSPAKERSYLFWLKVLNSNRFIEYNIYRAEDDPRVTISTSGTYDKIK